MLRKKDKNTVKKQEYIAFCGYKRQECELKDRKGPIHEGKSVLKMVSKRFCQLIQLP